MNFRTDLAIETEKIENTRGFSSKKYGYVTMTFAEIEDENTFSKPKGRYVTLEFPQIDKLTDFSDLNSAIKGSLNELLPNKRDNILLVGLGNSEITSDNIGPKTATQILATRHIAGEFAESIGLKGLKSVSVMSPNVLGKTGIEVSELVSGAVEVIKPDAVIVIDALCSKSTNRLFSTIQMCDSGISPGSGVKNSRKELSQKTLGVPCVAIGVPTVVEASTVAYELTGKEIKDSVGLILTPKDTDLLSHRISEVLATALNVFLQPETDSEIILSLV